MPDGSQTQAEVDKPWKHLSYYETDVAVFRNWLKAVVAFGVNLEISQTRRDEPRANLRDDLGLSRI